MTVVNTAHNKDTIGMVTDSMGTFGIREKFTLDKLYNSKIKDTLIGVTGSMFFLDTVMSKLDEGNTPKNTDIRSASKYVQEIMSDLRIESIDRRIKGTFGINFEDVISGNGEKIDSSLMSTIQSQLSNSEGQYSDILNNAILMSGFYDKDPEIYIVNATDIIKISNNYASVGSGNDQSIQVMDEFYETKSNQDAVATRDLMENIVRAKMKSSKYNQGVGGRSNIAILKNGSKPRIIDANESRLFEEIIHGKDKGLLPKRKANKNLEAILNGEKFEVVYPEIFDSNPKDDVYTLSLREYDV